MSESTGFDFNKSLEAINKILWADAVLYGVLAVGVLFTLWSVFCQYRALTHGPAVIRGRYDDPKDPGAINHFQALSAALSATVGLGNIGGVALAIALGGPGAVFWMWIVGFFGMAIKTTEVTLSMLYRNTDDPDDPHGGPMWVVSKGFAKWNPNLAWLGKLIGGIFCITLLISAITGGNMFQSWNVGIVTEDAVRRAGGDIDKIIVGIVLAVLVGLVIIGGIKRIGNVAGKLVPVMCLLYLAAALWVLINKIDVIPDMIMLIVKSAFGPTEAQGAFIGGTVGYAFLWGMKRALFSNEAGQGSAPIAHSAAKTDEPVREAVVAGLEPFIDTIVVCTLTALVILASGAHNREAETKLDVLPKFEHATQIKYIEDGKEKTEYGDIINRVAESDQVDVLIADNGDECLMQIRASEVVETVTDRRAWTLAPTALPDKFDDAKRVSGVTTGSGWKNGDSIFLIFEAEENDNTGNSLHRLQGSVYEDSAGDHFVSWGVYEPDSKDYTATPIVLGTSVYVNYVGAALTTHAFDRVTPGLGTWLVLIASWLFAISTMISWSYYGEQGIIYLLGSKAVLPYKIIYCALIIVACTDVVQTERELDNLTTIGTGVMLFANIPIMLLFGYQAMNAYHTYIGKLKRGEFHPHTPASITDVVEGKDVE